MRAAFLFNRKSSPMKVQECYHIIVFTTIILVLFTKMSYCKFAWASLVIGEPANKPAVKKQEAEISPRPFLSPTQYSLLEELLDTHLNYFLSDDAITVSGFPLGAYKEGDRGRYNYSNPTEWGYTLLAWIIAAERGKITVIEAASKIDNALNTMVTLQNDPAQNYQKLFYPYYRVLDSETGNDLSTPYHDDNHEIPSIDNGFLYTSLLIVEGWATINGLTVIENKAKSISSKMNFRIFLEPGREYLAHTINADDGNLGPSHWNIYADEGGVMAWIAYMSDSITLNEYKTLINAMMRPCRMWNGIFVSEAAWFNAMFTWGVRSLAGFPVATWETGLENCYSLESFANAVEAHLAYGDWLGVYYPAFSDAMTQGYTGHFTPPNIQNTVPEDIPEHIIPHALFVPFCIGPDLEPGVLATLFAKISDLKVDLAGYYHDGTDGHKPFGYEVTASPQKDDVLYNGVESRYIYETLSHAYILISLYQGLNIHDGKRTLLHYASQIPGYPERVEEVLGYLYPDLSGILRVPQDYPTIQEAIDAAVSGDTILVAGGLYNETLTLNKSAIMLHGENRGSTIKGANGSPVIYCEDISEEETVISGFEITSGSYGVRCAGTVSSLRIEDNLLSGNGVYLEEGASVMIKNNDIWDCAPVTGVGNNRVDMIGNTTSNTLGPNPPGISLSGATVIIKDNTLESSWNGAIKLYNDSNAIIVGNTLRGNYGWAQPAGIKVDSSTATLWNNIIADGKVYSSASVGVGLDAFNSNIFLYNNIFYNNEGASISPPTTRGVAIKVFDTNLVAKNNIICENSNGRETVYFGGAGTQDFSYNNMWGDTTTQDTNGITLGPGNIAVDPLFVNPAGRDYRLQSGSLCIDAGDPDPNYNDLDGTHNDMGAYGSPFAEYRFLSLADLNNDSKIDFKDYAIFAGNCLKQGPSLEGDINGNGVVDRIDLKLLVLYWLNNCVENNP